MGWAFDGIPRHADGSYYYNNIPLIEIPVAQCEGTCPLDKESLDEWFGITKHLPRVPKYMIFPEISPYDNRQDLPDWNPGAVFLGGGFVQYNMNGGWAVYEPVSWVPIVNLVKVIPKNELSVTTKRTTTKVETSRLYAGLKTLSSVSAGGSYGSMKAEVGAEAKGEIEVELKTEKVEEIIEQGKLGEKAALEVVMGMAIRARRVYSWKFQKDDVWYKMRFFTFEGVDGGWGAPPTDGTNLVPSGDLIHVDALRYKLPVFDAQVLPVLKDGKISDMHVVMKSKQWKDYYAYGTPQKWMENGGQDTLAWQPMKPVATIILA